MPRASHTLGARSERRSAGLLTEAASGVVIVRVVFIVQAFPCVRRGRRLRTPSICVESPGRRDDLAVCELLSVRT